MPFERGTGDRGSYISTWDETPRSDKSGKYPMVLVVDEAGAAVGGSLATDPTYARGRLLAGSVPAAYGDLLDHGGTIIRAIFLNTLNATVDIVFHDGTPGAQIDYQLGPNIASLELPFREDRVAETRKIQVKYASAVPTAGSIQVTCLMET